MSHNGGALRDIPCETAAKVAKISSSVDIAQEQNKTKEKKQNKIKQKRRIQTRCGFLGSPPPNIVTSILSFLLVTLLLLIDCPCNVINCVANEHSFIHMTIFVSIAVYLRFEFMLWDSSKSLTR